jgi:hypothetical protein
MANNFGPSNPRGTLDDFTTMLRIASSENSQLNDDPVDTQYRAAGPTIPASLNNWPITVLTLASHGDLSAILTPAVGACRRLACDGSWVVNRDAVDARILDYITAPATSPTALVTTAGPYPVLDAGTPCADGDGDGMPDVWEDAHGLASGDASDRNVVRELASGYTNLELCLSGLFPNGTPPPTALQPSALALTPLSQGVLKAGDSVEVQPSWRNDGAGATADMAGSVTVSSDATLVDGTASYGVVAAGATASCTGTSDCYSLTASGPRPASHWDITLTETLSEGASHAWLLHVGDSFTDVPRTSGYSRFVETLLHEGVAGGCTATSYCPGTSATRGQMAVFALVGKEGASYSPPACGGTPMFADVPVTSPLCEWIEELVRRGIGGGCTATTYCPGAVVTRGQMPIFMLKTLDPAIDPPACTTPMFADLPSTSPYCRWVEELARRGVVGGCGGGQYCPTSPVIRGQMAVFIASTFGLTPYGP